jgi:hypothetical protein
MYANLSRPYCRRNTIAITASKHGDFTLIFPDLLPTGNYSHYRLKTRQFYTNLSRPYYRRKTIAITASKHGNFTPIIS